MSPSIFRQDSTSRRRRGLSFLWAIVVMAASIEPRAIKAHLKTTGDFHLFTHVAAFGLGAFAAIGPGCIRRHWSYAFAWLAVVGITSEYFEALVYASSFEWGDLVADMIGALSGLAILAFWRRRSGAAD